MLHFYLRFFTALLSIIEHCIHNKSIYTDIQSFYIRRIAHGLIIGRVINFNVISVICQVFEINYYIYYVELHVLTYCANYQLLMKINEPRALLDSWKSVRGRTRAVLDLKQYMYRAS